MHINNLNNTNLKGFLENRPWGTFLNFGNNIKCTAKVLEIKPGGALSLQFHNHRAQHYYLADEINIYYSDEPVPDDMRDIGGIYWWFKKHLCFQRGKPGDQFYFDKRVVHRAVNITNKLARIFEVAYGENDEEDIVRLEDLYGRQS